MSAGRVSRIQRRYEENIRQSNSRSYNASPNASRGQQSSVRTQQENFRQGQQPQNTWGDSVRSGFTTLREARPVQGLTNFVAESIPKVANTAWTKCGADTTWEEFDFGTNPFKGGNNFFKQGEDFTGDIISDDDSIGKLRMHGPDVSDSPLNNLQNLVLTLFTCSKLYSRKRSLQFPHQTESTFFSKKGRSAHRMGQLSNTPF